MTNRISFSTTSFTPKTKIRIFGLPRSGNHAIINWLIRNSGASSYIFLNNCLLSSEPFASYMSLEIDGFKFSSTKQYFQADQKAIEKASSSNKNLLFIVSYERTLLHEIKSDFDPCYNYDAEFIIIRRFPSWFASLYALYIKEGPKRGKSAIETYRWILSLAQRYKNLISSLLSGYYSSFSKIIYDEWISDRNTRERILMSNSFNLIDNSLGDIANYGGGSSFALKDPNQLLTMQPRWLKMKNDTMFSSCMKLVLNDTEFIDLLLEVDPTGEEDLTKAIQFFSKDT
jgi:hypothetical protein